MFEAQNRVEEEDEDATSPWEEAFKDETGKGEYDGVGG